MKSSRTAILTKSQLQIFRHPFSAKSTLESNEQVGGEMDRGKKMSDCVMLVKACVEQQTWQSLA